MNDISKSKSIEELENRIKSLSRIMIESETSILYLDQIIADHVTAKDNEVKKKESLRIKIDVLSIELDKLKNQKN